MHSSTSPTGGTIRAAGRNPLAIIGLVLAAATAGFSSDRVPDSPVFPPVDPSLRPPAPERSLPPHSLRVDEFAPADTSVVLNLPTHIAFAGGFEIISEVVSDRFSYRPLGSGAEWTTSPLAVNGPHAVAYSSAGQVYFSADTDNHRVLAFDRIDDTASEWIDAIAGVGLVRPHDVLVDPDSGLVYVINPSAPVVLRFSAFGADEAALNLSAVAGGYSRGLSLVDGKILVVASSQGLIIEINDFATGDVTVHETYGKIASAFAGSWETTGFIPNDIEFYDGYWYLSNFFHPAYASGTDHNRFKLVRFRTWDDLATGRWEELSQFVADRQVPYFFSLYGGDLYLAAFHSSIAADAIYRITSGLFLDDFESGDLSAWELGAR